MTAQRRNVSWWPGCLLRFGLQPHSNCFPFSLSYHCFGVGSGGNDTGSQSLQESKVPSPSKSHLEGTGSDSIFQPVRAPVYFGWVRGRYLYQGEPSEPLRLPSGPHCKPNHGAVPAAGAGCSSARYRALPAIPWRPTNCSENKAADQALMLISECPHTSYVCHGTDLLLSWPLRGHCAEQ